MSESLLSLFSQYLLEWRDRVAPREAPTPRSRGVPAYETISFKRGHDKYRAPDRLIKILLTETAWRGVLHRHTRLVALARLRLDNMEARLSAIVVLLALAGVASALLR